jgi:hypothetical protein
VKVNTFQGHHWYVKLNGVVVLGWEVDASKASRRYVISHDVIEATAGIPHS